ncbi:MAG: hypothetical protein IPI12_13180 [Ignavibacteriales bacterium]|nr:hypothetical protein [Ignavibacteriales bacterium]
MEYAEFMGMAHKPDKAIDGYQVFKNQPNNVEILSFSSLYYQRKSWIKIGDN